ncbi:HAMP domain-containing sensor histidine kinase [Pontibacillus litoralis]|uniref:histidine kinase n=1 Tax=Pontibacillus litoralis JSM 072002 TaxID=1385512 RepID=A0A0A5G868_9BACI|nr:HAMP domain-containing sensor histidine kinase [Pontibacillus litoralis]KGX87368.1 histidine kinase [Pontibacillus litoralis JSM 072002]
MKLRTRIQLLTTVVLMVLLLIANTSIYFIFKNQTIDSEQRRLTNTANNIIMEMTEQQNVPMEQVLRAYIVNDGVLRIVDEEQKAPIVQVAADKRYRGMEVSYTNNQIDEVFEYNGSWFVGISIPMISNETGEIVNLQVIENINMLYGNMQDLKWVLIITTTIVIIILFITSRFLGKVITLPIYRLTKTMKTIENQGSFEHITVDNDLKDELSEMARTFNRMMTRLEESYERQEQFVSDASHELRTPLTVIDSYVKLLNRWGKERPDILEEAIQAIGSESVRMKYLTEQLLLLAKAEETKEEQKEVIDIAANLNNMVKRLQRAFPQKIIFHHEMDSCYLKVHEPSFEQLMIILLDNAKKYSEETITLQMVEEEQVVRIDVIDKGIGIPEEAQSHVFSRMYRVDKARSRKTGGSGLGLSIAKRIVDRHNGTISVKSKEGVGSTFTVTLPKGGIA